MDVALEPTFVVSDPVDLFSGLISGFDVFPDGRRLVVIDNRTAEPAATDGGPEPSRIVVVLDWFDVIRERLNAAGARSPAAPLAATPAAAPPPAARSTPSSRGSTPP